MTDRTLQLPSHDDYTIGWISALATESAAAAEMLDEEDPPLTVRPGDTNDYVLGRIGQHRVVMACINQAGGLPAHVVATHLMESFPAVRHVLMVGIGAGIPSERYPIRLGDVIVSEPTLQSAGVIQSDMGKWESHGFRVTGSLNRPAESLIRATGAMKRNRLRKRTQIHTLVRHFKGDVLQPDAWRYQGRENDPLHATDVELRVSGSCAECAASPRDYAPDPMVHYGVVASGNQVIKSERIRGKIRDELGACCVEMEAFGLMNHFPCLVIRGVSDYADESKNDQWQQYAALTAAAYAKELLLQLSSAREGPTASEQFEKIRRHIYAIHEDLKTSTRLDEERTTLFKAFCQDHQSDRILSWLAPADPANDVSEARHGRCEGTGSWLLDSDRFKAWVSRSGGDICLEGMPGSGKTTLCSMVLDQLKMQQGEEVKGVEDSANISLCFFFDFKKPSQQSLDDLLRSLAMQLYIHYPSTKAVLDKVYAARSYQKPTTGSLTYAVLRMLDLVHAVHLVIDALDECGTRIELLSFLETLICSKKNNVYLLVTTRKDVEIQMKLKRFLPENGFMQVRMEYVDPDIREYVTWRLREDAEFARWRADVFLQNEIVGRIMRKAGGMFRWAVCQMNRLARCLHRRAIQEVLNTMPDTLADTYSQILTQTKEHRRDAIRIFQFLLYSERPLTVGELADAIVVEPAGKNSFDPDLRLGAPDEVTHICPSMVEAVSKPDQKIVQLTHSSVKEYLLSGNMPMDFQNCLEKSQAMSSLAEVCLTYLFQLDETMSVDEIQSKFPLARYAARYWMDFARSAEWNRPLQSQILEFFGSPHYKVWRKLFNPETPWVEDPSELVNMTAIALYDACLGGLWRIVQALSRSHGINIDIECGIYGSSLQAASSRGHEDVVRVLLRRGANANPTPVGVYGCPLHAALDECHTAVARVLINAGANVNTEVNGYGSPLQVASAVGLVNMVQYLIRRGAAVNDYGGRYGSALQAACSEGHAEVVMILLANGADVDSCGKIFRTTLERRTASACFGPHRLRADMQSDGMAGAGFYRSTALQAACFKGHEEIVKILLAYGVDVHAPGGEYGDAFQAASSQGHKDIEELLVEEGLFRRQTFYNEELFEMSIRQPASDKPREHLRRRRKPDRHRYRPSFRIEIDEEPDESNAGEESQFYLHSAETMRQAPVDLTKSSIDSSRALGVDDGSDDSHEPSLVYSPATSLNAVVGSDMPRSKSVRSVSDVQGIPHAISPETVTQPLAFKDERKDQKVPLASHDNSSNINNATESVSNFNDTGVSPEGAKAKQANRTSPVAPQAAQTGSSEEASPDVVLPPRPAEVKSKQPLAPKPAHGVKTGAKNAKPYSQKGKQAKGSGGLTRSSDNAVVNGRAKKGRSSRNAEPGCCVVA